MREQNEEVSGKGLVSQCIAAVEEEEGERAMGEENSVGDMGGEEDSVS